MKLCSLTILAGMLCLGLVACGSSHKKKASPKKAKHPPSTVVIKQTGSNLTRHVTLSDDDEESAAKAKAKRKKKVPVDDDYLPRGGFR